MSVVYEKKRVFLESGKFRAALIRSGKIPVCKDKFIKWVRGYKIILLIYFRILCEIPIEVSSTNMLAY